MLTQVAAWVLQCATSLYTTLSTQWGYIGIAIVFFPILRKLIRLMQRIFSF